MAKKTPDPVYVGTVGIPIRLTILVDEAVHDPTAASVKNIVIIKPDGTKVTKTATVGTDSQGRTCLEYVTAAGDLDQAGIYKAVGYIEDVAGKWPTEPATWVVQSSLI